MKTNIKFASAVGGLLLGAGLSGGIGIAPGILYAQEKPRHAARRRHALTQAVQHRGHATSGDAVRSSSPKAERRRIGSPPDFRRTYGRRRTSRHGPSALGFGQIAEAVRR